MHKPLRHVILAAFGIALFTAGGLFLLIPSLQHSASAAVVQEQEAPPSETADDPKERLAKATELLTLTGAAEMAQEAMEMQIQQMQQMNMQVPPGFFQAFRNEIDTKALIDGIAEVYARNLTVEEMQAAIDFYNTPNGKRFLDKQGVIMQEAARVGEVLGQKWAVQAMDKLQQ